MMRRYPPFPAEAFAVACLCLLASTLYTPAQLFHSDPLVLMSPNRQAGGGFSGGAVAAVPDVNGNGSADIVVGAQGEFGGAGRVYVFDGTTLEVLHEFMPQNAGDGDFGRRVAGLGDVTGDGLGEVIGSTSNSGGSRTYVFDGGTGGLAYTLHGYPRSVAAVPDATGDGLPDVVLGGSNSAALYDGSNGSILRGFFPPGGSTNLYGSVCAGLPDVNGDGRGDVVVTDWMFGGQRGEAYVFDGARGALLHTLKDPRGGGGEQFGRSVAGLQDVNGDGFGDVLIGANGSKKAHVFDGATGTQLYEIRAQGGEIDTAHFGWVVEAVPDVSGDGINDLIVAGFGNGSAQSKVFVFDGTDGAHLATFSGHADFGNGHSVAGISDLNGDGRGEVLVGNYNADGGAGRLSIYLSNGPAIELDSDGDGLLDFWEIAHGLDPEDDGSIDPANGADGDPDNDGLTNLQEQEIGTNPQNADTDGDGLPDNVETNTGIYLDSSSTGTDATKPDTDGDGLLDGVENPTLPFIDQNQPGTDPNLANTDGDGLDDLTEILAGRDPTVADDPVPQRTYIQNFDLFENGARVFDDGSDLTSNENFTASVQGGRLQLTSNSASNSSAFHLPPLENSSKGWTATFDFTISDTNDSSPPADGLSFSYGAIPPILSSQAEKGWPNQSPVLSFRIDTYGGDAGPSISVDDLDIVGTNGGILFQGQSVSGTATISWNPAEGASFITTGLNTNANFASVPTLEFAGDDIHTFAIAARTGGFHQAVFIDNISITPAEPPDVNLRVRSESDNLVFTWDSEPGAIYEIRSSADLSLNADAWPALEGADEIAATPPMNLVVLPRPAAPELFFVVFTK